MHCFENKCCPAARNFLGLIDGQGQLSYLGKKPSLISYPANNFDVVFGTSITWPSSAVNCRFVEIADLCFANGDQIVFTSINCRGRTSS